MSCSRIATLLLSALVWAESVRAQETAPANPPQAQLKVFLDCQNCFQDFLRTEVTFVDYVRDRTEADVHVLITSASTGSGGREYTGAFIGLGKYADRQQTLKAITTTGDTEDIIRRQLANMLRLGLLGFITQDGVPQRLQFDVKVGT